MTLTCKVPLTLTAVALLALTVGCSSQATTPVASATGAPSASSLDGIPHTLPLHLPTPSPTWHSNAAPNPLGPTCTSGQLRGSSARGVVPQTGETSLFINLVNISKAPCTLGGYPEVRFHAEVRFSAPGPLLPFQVHHTGNYLTGENAEPARQQQVLPGAAVHIFIAKYRCDNGPTDAAHSVNVQLLGGASLAAFPLDPGTLGVTTCQPPTGTPAAADPGNVLQISAFLAGQGSGN